MKRTVARPAEKLLAAATALMLIVAVVAGCSTSSPAQQFSSVPLAPTGAGPVYKDPITVDCFDTWGNYNGLQSGWFGKIIQDKFNMQINFIAPNSAMTGDMLFQTRSAAGNLGDLVIFAQTQLPDSVKAGLFMDITDLLQTHGMNYASTFPNAVEKIKKYLTAQLDTDKIYAIPMCVSTQSPLSPMLDGQKTQYGSYMRLDYYLGIGAPKLNTLDDLLPMLQQMQQKYPTSDSGKKTYGFSFFKDWDGGGCMQNAGMLAFMYGWTRFTSTCFYNPGNGQTQSFIDDNGIYLKTLKMYFKANQMGLVDPDSPAQNWDTLVSKVTDGQVLFSWWSWLGIPTFNTPDHMAAGKGFAYVPIADEKIYNDGMNPNGSIPLVIGIGSKAKDPVRLMDFIDWMSTPDAFQVIYAGPEGLAWEMKDGQPVLTDYGKDCFTKNSPVPAGYGGGYFNDGAWGGGATVIMINRGTEMNPKTNAPYDYRLWPSTIVTNVTQLDKNWQSTFGAQSQVDYLNQHNMIVVEPGNDYVLPQDSSDVKNERDECSKAVVDTSWKMIFAKDENEFNRLWQDMKTQVQGFGYDSLYTTDQKYTQDRYAAAQAAIAAAPK